MNAQLMKLEELKAEAWVALDQARKEADAAVPGRRLMRVDLLSFTEALADPILGEPTAKAAVSGHRAGCARCACVHVPTLQPPLGK